MPSVLTTDLRESIIAHNLDIISASKLDITDEMLQLAERLAQIHGRIRVTNEAHGIHFYMPSPICLKDYGTTELDKMHLAVNVQKYYEQGEDRCGYCMKSNTPYSVSDLLSMPPLNERGYELKPQVLKVARARLDVMEQDANGAWIPKSPGTVVPVYKLPAYHPAQVYLRSRNFDAKALWDQFRLSYCIQERNDIFYRQMLNGFRATPQGRIIFFIDIEGINRGWQSRILEMETDGVMSYWHPYSKKWVPVKKRQGDKWVPYEDKWIGWDDSKYVISHGCRRNECVMGLDAALAWNKTHDTGKGYRCVLAEGGLDAGRVGPPAMAVLGKAFSENQCALVAKYFHNIVYVRDDDAAGESAANTVSKRFGAIQGRLRPNVTIILPPNGKKDLGNLTQAEADQFRQVYGL